MMRQLFLSAALTVAVLAGPAAAQVLDQNDAKFILDWLNSKGIDYITDDPSATWQYVGVTSGGVAMRAVLSEKKALSPAKVGLRIEHFAATPGVSNLATLSELATFEVDCAKDQIRHTSTTSYTAHDFAGQKKTQSERGAWIPTASFALLDGAVKSVCDPTKKNSSDVSAPPALRAPLPTRSAADRAASDFLLGLNSAPMSVRQQQNHN